MNNTEYSKIREDTESPQPEQADDTLKRPTSQQQQESRAQQNDGINQEEEKKSSQKQGLGSGGVKFECNICLDIANEPVVTSCGHLYCWVCIYQWINQPKETLLCPVCKSGISAETLIPIYTKGCTEDPRQKQNSEIPKRPAGQRQGPIPNQNFQNNGFFGNRSNGGFMMGVGLFPALFTLNFTWDDIFGSNNGGGNAGNNEETRDQQIYRLLMIFMTFMFMCFVFFGGDVFLTF